MKAILFDLDNTLLDFKTLKMSAISAALKAMIATGLPITYEKGMEALDLMFRQHGLDHQHIFQDFFTTINFPLDNRMLAAAVVAYRTEKVHHVRTYPGVKETLTELRKRGYKLAIVTDAKALNGWIRLHELGIQNYFDAVITFDDTGQKKPHELPFKKALERLGVTAADALHVGDWPERDIAGAKQLGIKTALAVYGMTPNKKKTVEADYNLEKIEDLLLIAPRH